MSEISEKPAKPGPGATTPAGGAAEKPPASPPAKPALPPEIGGPTGPEPTRYGDWERKGRVSDF